MARFTCAHIKKDNTICGNKCCDPTGCYRHWKLYEKNIEKKPCLVSGCRKYTLSTTGCCPDHSSRFHSLNYRMRQKYGAETLQPKVPEAPIFELSDVVRPLQPRIYENPVSESDDEDISLGLF